MVNENPGSITSVALRGIVKSKYSTGVPVMVQVFVFPVHVPSSVALQKCAPRVGLVDFGAYTVIGVRTATEDTTKTAIRTNATADFVFIPRFSP
jgi:hypothetical protein